MDHHHENQHHFLKTGLLKTQVASRHLSVLAEEKKNDILEAIKKTIGQNRQEILKANAQDIALAKKDNLSSALIDRLLIDDKRIDDLIKSLNDIIELADPVGEVLEGKTLKGGVELIKKRVPLGVVLVIYESRPNVTLDIAALCIKSGNACILKGGKEALQTNVALANCITTALKQSDASLENAVTLVPDASRELVSLLIKCRREIDIVIPRGGTKLIEYVMQNSSIPVIAHDKGVCNLFIEEDAPSDKAINIAINAKTQRPGVCNAIENILIHKNFPYKKALIQSLLDKKVEVRLDDALLKSFSDDPNNTFPDFPRATEEDWDTEYLDLIISIHQVSDIYEACDFINRYGSKHSDAIVTNSLEKSKIFEKNVDSACLAINVSTRYHDGSMFGMGAEVGTSTQKLHVRGTMGLKDLTTTKYVLIGSGQIRQ